MIPWLSRLLGSKAVIPRPPAGPTDSKEVMPTQVFHDAAVRFLDLQISTDDILDNKTAGAFSVGSTVLPLTFGLLNLGTNSIRGEAEIALVLALVAYIVQLICAGRASFIRGFEYRPHIPTLRKHSETYPGEALQRWVGAEYETSIDVNEEVLVLKARWVGAAIAALYAEGLLLAIAAVLVLLL